MDRRTLTRLIAFLLIVFGGTTLRVLRAQGTDAVLAVEKWSRDIQLAADAAGLEDPFLLAGLVYAESRGQVHAVSSEGAFGLCQLLPSTADELALRHDIDAPYDARDGLLLGAHYLAELLRHRDGDVDLALLSYRLGPGHVSRGIDDSGGGAAFCQELRLRKPSPWEWRTQVLRCRDRFAERAAAGIGW